MEERLIQCYPNFRLLARHIRLLPLTARSLLIKCCQGMYDCSEKGRDSNLQRLVEQHPVVPITPRRSNDGIQWVPLYQVFQYSECSPEDPLIAGIMLDILRSSPLPRHMVEEAVAKSWSTEIRLAESRRSGQCDFSPYFFDTGHYHIHPLLPENPDAVNYIRSRFLAFRESIIQNQPVFYPSSSKKWMSRSTVRAYEADYLCAENVYGIEFSQEDWQRLYHETGVKIGGTSELRQRWYPSNHKPRTYFAQGGCHYASSRYLQDFCNRLCDLFPPTQKKAKVTPSRLTIPFTEPPSHFRVYDFSSFTSNLAEYVNFFDPMIAFFGGIRIRLFDENQGVVDYDLGQLLAEYQESCLRDPELSYERVPGYGESNVQSHGIGSFLGIYGNLATATLIHYILMVLVCSNPENLNVAGDDGAVPENEESAPQIGCVWTVIGDIAIDKTSLTKDPGCVHLKRPLFEDGISLVSIFIANVPSVSKLSCYLYGRAVDPRYSFDLQPEDHSPYHRVSVIGKDLIRFLMSCHKRGVYSDDVLSIYSGWCRLIEKVLGFYPIACSGRYHWPIDPSSYDFLKTSPFEALWYFLPPRDFTKRGYVDEVSLVGLTPGDEFESNSSAHFRILVTLGFLERLEVLEWVESNDVISKLEMEIYDDTPYVYRYCVLRPIPPPFASVVLVDIVTEP